MFVLLVLLSPLAAYYIRDNVERCSSEISYTGAADLRLALNVKVI